MNSRHENRCRWGHRAGMTAYLRGAALMANPFNDEACPECGHSRSDLPMHNYWRKGWITARNKMNESKNDKTP